MTVSFFSIPAILLYFITWILIIRCVKASMKKTEAVPQTKKYHFFIWLLALVLHILALHAPIFAGEPLTLSFLSLASYVMWFLSLILFITTIKRRVESLAIVILPFTILSMILALTTISGSNHAIDMKSGLGIHVLVSLLAYSVMMLASFQAALLDYQNKLLHNHQITGFIRTLPALEDMEHLLFRFIGIGVALLTLSLLSGFYYLDNLFGSGIAHKTILSIIAWLVFSALLLGRWKYGWRGRTAVRFTLAGFIILMLAFFGTKFVQEFLLS